MSKVFTVERAESILSGPLSEDLPENIEAIDKAAGEAILAGKLDLHGPYSDRVKVFKEFLEAKGLLPSNWPIEDLFNKMGPRILFGLSSWDWGLGEKHKDLVATYQKLKERPSVKKAVEVGGLCQETLFVIRSIEAIDEKLAQGGTYNDAFTSIIYSDDSNSNHAFLNHAEEKFQTEITNAKRLQELTGIDPDLSKDVENSFLMALESRYGLALDKTLRKGGKCKDLLALTPKAFGLPEKWIGASEVEQTQEGMILRAISSRYSLSDSHLYRIPLREVAKELEAPYSVVLKASRVWE